MKKLIMLITFIIILFIFFLIIYLKPRNYEKSYEVNKLMVKEQYIKKDKKYYIVLKFRNKKYEMVTNDKYTVKRKLIKNIKTEVNNDIFCLKLESNYLTTYPLCSNNSDIISYNMTENKKQNIVNTDKFTYNNIDVNYLNNKTYLLWNYQGFYLISSAKKMKINYLKKDTYNPKLATKINNLLFVPDYSSDHKFNQAYTINIKNGEIKKWDMEYEIYFDSYILGTYKKSIFLYDLKNETEYEIRIDKQKMRKIKPRLLVNNKWENTSIGNLNKKVEFNNSNIYNFEVINSKLYMSYSFGKTKILLTDMSVKDIVYVDNNTVYYLVEDTLYMYNNEVGNVKIMSYYEWNFNYQNMIFIY